MPVDLEMSENMRLKKLQDVLDVCGLTTNAKYVASYAKDWPVSNSRKTNNPMKIMYSNRDLNQLYKIMPEEIEFLKNQENFLRPSLEKLGYKNLLWW